MEPTQQAKAAVLGAQEQPNCHKTSSPEDKANRIFEAAPTAMLVVSANGCIESANTAAMRLFGYNWDQLVGMNVDQLVPAHLRKTHTQDRNAYLEEPRARSMGHGKTLAAIRSDGTGFPVEVGLTPLRDNDGLSIIVSIVDLTAQGKAHDEIRRLNHELASRLDAQSQALNLTEKDLRSILDHMPSMIGYWDRNLRNRFGNRAYLEWFGISPQDMPGQHMREVIGAERFEWDKPYIDGALAGQIQFFERAIPSADGSSIRHTQAQYLPDIGPDGETQGFYVLVNDVTPIKRAQARAQDLLHFNQAIINSSPVGIAVYHPEGQCLLANQALAKAYGKTEDELLSENFYDIPHWETSGLLEDAISVLKQGITRTRTCLTQTAEGITQYLACSLQPIIRNERVHLLLIANDITRQEVANKAIATALDAAKHAAEAKSEFLSSMSHEIRTPLNAVLGLAQLGECNSRDGQSAKAFGQINEAGQHLLALINDVLDFSKIEAGKLKLKQAPVDTAHLLQHLCTMIAGRAHAKGLQFDIQESANFPCHFLGDDTRLAQILLNLLGNAVKFTQVGQVALKLSVDGGDLRFEVEDTGPGIHTAQQSRLFSPFEQLSDSPDALNSSGLGLAISKKLSELMGGILLHRPNSSHGCCFELRIPLKEAVYAQWQDLPSITTLDGDKLIQPLAQKLAARGVTMKSAPPSERVFSTDHLVLTSNQGQPGSPFPFANTTLAQARLTVLLIQEQDDSSHALNGFTTVVPVHAYTTPLMLHHAIQHALHTTEPHRLQQRLSGIRILAAEDNPVNRLVLEQMMLQEGATIDFGFDGQQALEWVKKYGPEYYDIVLCDIQMPVMDGFETTRILTQMAPELPVIGLTAHAFETARLQAKEAGMIDYVTKPYLLDTLVAVILKHARQRSANSATSTSVDSEITKPSVSDPAYPDWRAMQDHFGSNPALMRKLTETLCDAGEQIIMNMTEAIDQQDFARIRYEAHSLKGAALNLHTPQLARQAAELQNLASLQAPLALSLASDLIGSLRHFLSYLRQVR